jgi:endo-1,4-beta-D-glucanase Y
MDDAHLDVLIRSLTEGRSRRAFARLVAGFAGGGLLPLPLRPPESESRKRRSRRQRKRNRRRSKASSDPVGGGNGSSRRDTPARRPFPQQVTYTGGAILPNHRSQQQLDDDVRAAYDRWKQRYLVPVSSQTSATLYRVAFGKPGTSAHNTTVSEGQGYGMVIVPLMAGHDPQAQTIFDGLWSYALTHRSCGDERLMLWRLPNEGHGCASATDGDLDIAYGLLLADAQWGSGGVIDYRAAAKSVLPGILASTIGPQSKLPLLGDWVTPNGARANEWTPRTSDFMTGHFQAFGRATGNAVWHDVADASLDVVVALQGEFSTSTGLLPDFVQPKSENDHAPRPADAFFLEGATDGAYNYNAGRDPWRLGTDSLLNGDARARVAVAKISAWAQDETDGDPRQIRAGYALNGTPLPNSDYFTTFFAAPLGVAAMTVPSQQAWLNAIFDAVRERQENYYEDSITLLCMLVMTANFWDPTS